MKKDILDEVVRDMSKWMENLNFKYHKSSGSFIRKGVEVDQKIYLDLFSWTKGKSWNLSFQVAIRFHQVENILNKYKTHIKSKSDSQETNTFTKSMIDLCKDSAFQISSIEDVTIYKYEIEERIKTFAMPYLDKYSDISLVRAGFELEQNRWPVQDKIIRCEVLLSIYIIQNDTNLFHQSLEEFENIIKRYREGFYLSSFHKIVLGMRKDYSEIFT